MVPDPGSVEGFEETALLVADAQLVSPTVDPVSSDLRPLPGSPAVASGSTVDVPLVDRAGVSRPERPSVGAFESVSASN